MTVLIIGVGVSVVLTLMILLPLLLNIKFGILENYTNKIQDFVNGILGVIGL